MDEQLLIEVREKSFVVRFAINERMNEATIGMVSWDAQLAAAMIADRLGMKKESIQVISHSPLAER